MSSSWTIHQLQLLSHDIVIGLTWLSCLAYVFHLRIEYSTITIEIGNANIVYFEPVRGMTLSSILKVCGSSQLSPRAGASLCVTECSWAHISFPIWLGLIEAFVWLQLWLARWLSHSRALHKPTHYPLSLITFSKQLWKTDYSVTNAWAPTELSLAMVTPPNSGNAPVPFGTPVHTCSSTTRCLGTKHLTWDQICDVMSDEMAPFFLGPMPSQEFLLAFLPSPQPSHFQASMLDTLTCPQVQTEALMYKIFMSNCISISEVFWY